MCFVGGACSQGPGQVCQIPGEMVIIPVMENNNKLTFNSYLRPFSYVLVKVLIELWGNNFYHPVSLYIKRFEGDILRVKNLNYSAIYQTER